MLETRGIELSGSWSPLLKRSIFCDFEFNRIRGEGNTMLSRWIVRFAGISTICLAMCAAASAQYGGGGGTGGSGGTGGTGGSTGYVAPSGGYGSGKAIGIGVGAAAGAAVADRKSVV